MARAWGFWTRYKLELLETYLDRFTTASKGRASKTVYLDLFGGQPENVDRITGEAIEGSARIALNISNPPFTHLRFFELEPKATRLRDALSEHYIDRDWLVYSGDSNLTIHQGLQELKTAGVGWAPTFAFIDPNGPHYRWTTLEALAAHKGPVAKTKVELWMLFPDPLFARMLPTTGEVRPADNAVITEMFGTAGWHAIWRAKLDQAITPTEARIEYVDLIRWRLERELHYRWTHQLEIRNEQNRPIYHMIFATDSEPGHKIMSHLYDQAALDFPAMAQAARSTRGRLIREREGAPALELDFTSSELRPSSIRRGRERLYLHEPPDEPRVHDGTTCPYC